MLRITIVLLAVLAAGSASADDQAKQQPQKQAAAKAEKLAANDAKAKGAKAADAKTLAGISILGNQEAPKALVIVPWKSSEIGDPLGLDENLDGSRRPVDKEVFMRELDYYDIRSGSK